MLFNGIDAPKAGLDHKRWTITIVAQVGDSTTVYSPAIVLSPSQPYRAFLYKKDISAPTGVAVDVEGSTDGDNWVALFTLNDNAERLWTSPTAQVRLKVTLPSSPTTQYTVGVVQLITATV